MRAVEDAEEHGKLSSIIGAPLKATVEHIPLEQAIELVQDGKKIFSALKGSSARSAACSKN